MNNYVKNFLLHNFHWMKSDFIIYALLTVVATVAIYFVPNLNEGIKILFTFIILILNILFYCSKSNQLTKTNPHNFTWKFLQSLPMSKQDIILSFILGNLIAATPLLLSFLCFWRFLTDLLFIDQVTFAKGFLSIILIVIMQAILSIFSLISFQRQANRNQENGNSILMTFTVMCILSVILAYSSSSRLYVLIVETFPIFGHPFFSLNTIFSWWSVPAMFLFNIFLYFRLMKFWNQENLSYRNTRLISQPNFKNSVLSVISLVLFTAFFHLGLDIPLIYRGEVTEAIHGRKIKEIEIALRNNPNINVKNQYGLTPMLAAVKVNDLKIVKFLHDKGATFDGMVKGVDGDPNGLTIADLAVKTKNKDLVNYLISQGINFKSMNRVTGFSPIHIAAANCDSQMLDVLVKNGAEVNTLNSKGETPLIIAARKNCLSAGMVLKEAGANFEIADKDGKMALDLSKKYGSTELTYFIQKNTRTPASK